MIQSFPGKEKKGIKMDAKGLEVKETIMRYIAKYICPNSPGEMDGEFSDSGLKRWCAVHNLPST